VLALIVAGYFVYKNLVSEPKEAKANESYIPRGEYYRVDSARLGPERGQCEPGLSEDHFQIRRYKGG